MQFCARKTYKSDNSATVNESVSEAQPLKWVIAAYPKKTFSTVIEVSRRATWPRASNAKVVKKPTVAITHGQSCPRLTKGSSYRAPTKIDDEYEAQKLDNLFALIPRQLAAGDTASLQAETYHLLQTRKLVLGQ